MSFATYSRKTGKCWNQNSFTWSWPEIMLVICQNLIVNLQPVILPCFLPKIAQIMQKDIAFFPESGDKIVPWLWHMYIAQWLEFPQNLLISFNFSHLQRVVNVQSRGVVIIAAAQLHLTKSELRFCVGSNPARDLLEIRDDEDLWQWFRLEISPNAFRRSTTKQFNSKLDKKCKLWVRPILAKILNFQRFFKNCFCLLKYYLRCKFQQN